MCEYIMEMKRRERKSGRKEGIKEGMKKGFKKGRAFKLYLNYTL